MKGFIAILGMQVLFCLISPAALQTDYIRMAEKAIEFRLPEIAKTHSQRLFKQLKQKTF